MGQYMRYICMVFKHSIYLSSISMNPTLQTHSAQTLRILMLSEAKKFVQALEGGSSIRDLEEIRTSMKEIGDVLFMKEQEESKLLTKK